MRENADRPRWPPRAVLRQQPRHGHRLAFVLTLLLIVVVVVSLPVALASMRTQLFGEQAGALYDLVTGRVVTAADADRARSPSFFSISIVHIDEGTQVVSLSIAARRTC